MERAEGPSSQVGVAVEAKTAREEGALRTNNLMERGFREPRRRTRQMDRFGSDHGAANFHLLWMLKENARSNARDYLNQILPWTEPASTPSTSLP